jgi:hypothetical protein
VLGDGPAVFQIAEFILAEFILQVNCCSGKAFQPIVLHAVLFSTAHSGGI